MRRQLLGRWFDDSGPSGRRRRAWTAGTCSVVVIAGVLGPMAPTAAAASTIADCLAANAGIADIVCHEVTKLPGTPTVGRVKVSWQLVPGNLDSLQGGLWMVRSPIAGQRRGDQTTYPTADSRERCSNGNPSGFQDCAKVYSGSSGSFILEFPLAMAGYQYVLNASETLRNAQSEEGGADLRGNEVDTVVWVNQAFQFQRNGRTVVRRTCPSDLRQAGCKRAVLLELNSDVGTEMPVRPVG